MHSIYAMPCWAPSQSLPASPFHSNTPMIPSMYRRIHSMYIRIVNFLYMYIYTYWIQTNDHLHHHPPPPPPRDPLSRGSHALRHPPYIAGETYVYFHHLVNTTPSHLNRHKYVVRHTWIHMYLNIRTYIFADVIADILDCTYTSIQHYW
jgi:hypothetical protein